jgi:hypothetical protein
LRKGIWDSKGWRSILAYEVLIKLPKEFAGDARIFWKELRVADALPPDSDLPDPDTVDRFDGSALAEWIVPISEAMKPLIGAVSWLSRRAER